jgi:hypothetical protein
MPQKRGTKLRAMLGDVRRLSDTASKAYIKAEARLADVEEREARERDREARR